MVEKKEETIAREVEKKNEAGEKPAGGKIDGDLATVVLKLDLHCEGCAKKVKRSIRHLEGVEDVKADYSSGKLTVKGNVDPLWLLERVANKTKKKVDLLSDQPKKNGGSAASAGEDKKSDEKVEKKAVKMNAVDKKLNEPQFNTLVLKIQLHCDRCAEKVKRMIQKIEGVQQVSVSLEKNLVTVKGTMDLKEELTLYLKNKLKRDVEVVLPPKDGGGSRVGSEKKDVESEVASYESRELKEKRTEVLNKMEYHGSYANTYYTTPMYGQNYVGQDYGVTMHDIGYGHSTSYVPPTPPPVYLTAPQMFSDENPNGCSVM